NSRASEGRWTGPGFDHAGPRSARVVALSKSGHTLLRDLVDFAAPPPSFVPSCAPRDGSQAQPPGTAVRRVLPRKWPAPGGASNGGEDAHAPGARLGSLSGSTP